MTHLKIIGAFGVVTVLMFLIVLALPSSYASREELAEVNRLTKGDRLSRPCRSVGPTIAYGPACK
jgi:hypothetical protein